MDLISVVVPCYNESDSLAFIYKAFSKLANEMQNMASFEFIFVNDGSKDNTLKAIRELAKQDSKVKYISFSRNFGKEAAMLAGLEHAKGDFISVIDADLQDPPELLKQMYQIITTENFDCVATRRKTRKGEPFVRSLFSKMFYKLINKISQVEIIDGARDFRLMTRQMVNSILEIKEYNRFSKGIFSFVGYETKWLEYDNVTRVVGNSTWSFWKLFKYSLEGIFSFSTAPLLLSSFLGIILCVFSFIFIAYIVIKTLIWGEPVDGYPTLICVITFLGGIQLFSVGILGQYISKIYLETKKRPIYIIKEKSGEDE